MRNYDEGKQGADFSFSIDMIKQRRTLVWMGLFLCMDKMASASDKAKKSSHHPSPL